MNGRSLLRICFISCLLELALGLRCQTDDGHTDGELKRVVRKCMRKIGDNTYQQTSNNQGNHRNNQNSNPNGQNFGEDDYEYDDEWSNNNNNNNNKQSHHQRAVGRFDDPMWQRNHNRLYFNHTSDAQTAGGHNVAGNWYGHQNRSNNNTHGNQKTTQRSGHGLNNSNNNQNSQSNQSNNNRSNSNNNNDTYDGGCIAHCFFNELNMLNSDDYPDRQKVTFILSKDLRDRELRNFYIDTVQECFRYIESQRRRDKCSYSRELTSCMMEYFKSNCNDWDHYNILFT